MIRHLKKIVRTRTLAKAGGTVSSAVEGTTDNSVASTEECVIPDGMRPLALLPERAVLRYAPLGVNNANSGENWPVLQVENVFVLPGVPQYFKTKVKNDLIHSFIFIIL